MSGVVIGTVIGMAIGFVAGCFLGWNVGFDDALLDMMKEGDTDTKEQPHDCGTCRHAAQLSNKEPCASCSYAWDETPSKWEPKEVGNGQND